MSFQNGNDMRRRGAQHAVPELQDDLDARENFLHGRGDEDEDEASDGEEACRIVVAGARGRRDSSEYLIRQLVAHQNTIGRLQRKLAEARSELSAEETKGRYTALDLNNANVKIQEMREDATALRASRKNIQTELWNTRLEVYAMRAVVVAYITYRVVSLFSGFF